MTPLALPLIAVLAQAPTPIQPFLVRSNYLRTEGGLERAIAYRDEHYSDPPIKTTFMGVEVRLHPVAVKQLAKVEKTIVLTCTDDYKPWLLSGYRKRRTYHGRERSNHNYGIALDIDPELNPCCGCVGKWGHSPRCTDTHQHLGRYDLPRCWIAAFEWHGWYWLGHDEQLRDTMHFEYLGPAY